MSLIDKLDMEFKAAKKNRVRPQRVPAIVASSFTKRALGLLVACGIMWSSSNLVSAEGVKQFDNLSAIPGNSASLVTTESGKAVKLAAGQQELILDDASAGYTQARDLSSTDAAAAKELFQAAASKYQLLVDSGIRNSDLYANLGNAYLQSGELGRAMVNYERALRVDPGNSRAAVNLEFAQTLVEGKSPQGSKFASTTLGKIVQTARNANVTLVSFLGFSTVEWTLVIASLVFWSILTARAWGNDFPKRRWLAVPACMLVVSLGSAFLVRTSAESPWNAVIVANKVSLHAGDGEQFDEVLSIDAAQGHPVEVLTTRGTWTQIRTAEGQIGWVPSPSVESFTI